MSSHQTLTSKRVVLVNITCAFWSPCKSEEGCVTFADSMGKANGTQGVRKKAICLLSDAHSGLLTAHQVWPDGVSGGLPAQNTVDFSSFVITYQPSSCPPHPLQPLCQGQTLLLI